MAHRPILCLDFDGVLHGYQSGWHGASAVVDPPVPGAVNFLIEASRHFDVCVHSSRSHQPGGLRAMVVAVQAWLAQAGYAAAYSHDRIHTISGGTIRFVTEKPPAHVTIDDRAIKFTGRWPSMEELRAFQPWNKRAPEAAPPVAAPRRPGPAQEGGASFADLASAVATAVMALPWTGDGAPEADDAAADRYGDVQLAVEAVLREQFEQGGPLTRAALDVLAERRRQVEAEGWSPEHDDRYENGELARAGATYAFSAGRGQDDRKIGACPLSWPWPLSWWKPTTRRRDLVKSGALTLAEIERLDRAEALGNVVP